LSNHIILVLLAVFLPGKTKMCDIRVTGWVAWLVMVS